MSDSLIDNGQAPDDSGTPPVADAGQSGEPIARPDFIPEKFWNAETNEVRIEGLAKSYAEMEKARGNVDGLREQWEAERLASRPETPDAYALPANEALDMDALASSPIVSLWRKAAHEAALPQETFEQVINEYAQAEVDAMAARQAEELQKLGENANDRTTAVRLWAEKTFKEGELFAVQRIATDADGIHALERIMGALSERGIDVGGSEGTSQDDSYEDIQKLMQSKEYYDSSRRDPKVVSRVEQWFKKNAGKK